jgi:DNA segregation ATPase FtsK/SpoIIIE-like protein
MIMSEILLPSMNIQQEAKTKHLVEMISEYMGDEAKCESVISMKIVWPDDRVDMAAIFKKLAGNKKPLQKNPNGSKPVDGDEHTGRAPVLGMDEIVQKAIEMLKSRESVTVTILKDELHIGYTTALKLMDELEARGIIGPSLGSGKGRTVLLSGVEMEEELIESQTAL